MKTAADQFPKLAAHLEKLQDAVYQDLQDYLRSLEVPDKAIAAIEQIRCADIWLSGEHSAEDLADWLPSISEELHDAQIFLAMEMDGVRAKTVEMGDIDHE